MYFKNPQGSLLSYILHKVLHKFCFTQGNLLNYFSKTLVSVIYRPLPIVTDLDSDGINGKQLSIE